jgi:TatD DNase family protein
MRLVLDFGAMVSFTGVVTYRNAREVQEAARLAPPGRIMVETDAPFLSPDPHRGRRPCEPWMVSVTARRLAELRGEPWEEFHTAVNANTTRFFGIPA